MCAKENTPSPKRIKFAQSRGALDLVLDRDLLSLLRQALAEDVGLGDVTTESIISMRSRGRGHLLAKAEGIFCGAPVATQVWELLSSAVKIDWLTEEGHRVTEGQTLATFRGPYRALITGERVALNFLQRLSGTATLTHKMIEAAGGKNAPFICDTRKTTPLWRKLERYAVRAGGGTNHRFGLFDMALIKENHIRVAGSVAEAVSAIRKSAPRIMIAVEATNADEVSEACQAKASLILLDNMSPADAGAIVKRFRKAGPKFEVSGGITLENIGDYAKSGVDRISVGALTHSVLALDMSLQLYPLGRNENFSI